MRQTFVRLVSVFLVGIALGCGGRQLTAPAAGAPLGANEVFATTATVRFVPLEGGCWALETDRGRYEPMGLPPEFRVDGLAVYAVVRGAPDAVSVCMIAPLVTLDSIHTR